MPLRRLGAEQLSGDVNLPIHGVKAMVRRSLCGCRLINALTE